MHGDKNNLNQGCKYHWIVSWNYQYMTAKVSTELHSGTQHDTKAIQRIYIENTFHMHMHMQESLI